MSCLRGLVPVGEGRRWGNGKGGVTMLEILCIHVCKWKSDIS
jgi:hypothetical protein